MTDLNLDRLEALAKNAQPFARPGGIDPATVTIPAADLLALIQRTRKFANMLANYGNAINATLPRWRARRPTPGTRATPMACTTPTSTASTASCGTPTGQKPSPETPQQPL